MPRGRKPSGTKRLTTSLRLGPKLHEWVSAHENIAEFVRDMLQEAYLYSTDTEEDMANHQQRRANAKALRPVLAKAIGYVVLYVDPTDGGVKCICATSKLQNMEDPRSRFMAAVRDNAVTKVVEVNRAYLRWQEGQKQSEKVQQAKADRSAELAKATAATEPTPIPPDEPIDSSLVTTEDEEADELVPLSEQEGAADEV